MKIDVYQVNNSMSMDPMHDSYADEIRIENNSLIIVYDKLDEGVLEPDGMPYYKSKRLTIKYEFQTHCDARFYYSKNKYLWIDMLDDANKFNKITKDCIFMSYKYSVDSFNEIILDFEIHKGSRNQYKKYKYWGLEISLDATDITYIWE